MCVCMFMGVCMNEYIYEYTCLRARAINKITYTQCEIVCYVTHLLL